MSVPLKPFINPLVGRPLAYTPAQLAEKFAEYLEWSRENLIEVKEEEDGVTEKGVIGKTTKKYKQRLISLGGFLVFIGKTHRWWGELSNGKQGEKFSVLKAYITAYCEDYQKEMAAVGLFNANIISRLLGLADRQEVKTTGEITTIIVSSEKEKKQIETMKDLQI